MSTVEGEMCFLYTTTSREPTIYASLSQASVALQGLIHLQRGRGYETTRSVSGRFMSRHEAKATVVFWIERVDGEVVS